MKYRLLIGIILFTLASTTGYAQRQFKRQYQKPLRSSLEANSALGKYYLGFTVGTPWSWISLSNLNETSNKGRLGYQAGIAGERFFKSFSVGAYATITQRGTTLHNSRTYEISLTETSTVDKTMTIHYDVATFRAPIAYYLQHVFPTKRFIPYLFVAPEVEVPINLISDPYMETTTVIGNDSETLKETIQPKMNVCGVAGAGLLFKAGSSNKTVLVKFDLGMNVGLLNQASSNLQESGVFLRSHSLEANLTLLFLLKKPLRDAGYYFSRSGY
ncbi:MAG: hypothetical protein K6A28_02625 [Bacteroidales bacterium]|nr:hypothetical protein [Bacteroidales bacterium]